MTRRDDLDPMMRAVSDTLDDLLLRMYGISTSWSNPEWFVKWLFENGYEVVPVNAVEQALREAAKKWRPYVITRHGGCPTCTGPSRETTGLVCQTCGTDYGAIDA